MIDNFELIKPLLELPDKDNFYFVQILQRKKDHIGIRLGGSNNNSRLIKAYYINSIEKLDIFKEEMIAIADLFNARIGINLNPRSYEKAAFQTLEKIAHQMMNKDYYNVNKCYNSVCGTYHDEIDKRWIIDIDGEDKSRVNEIEHFINLQHKKILNKNYEVLVVLPTKNGYHIITNPFNLQSFSSEYPQIEVHKNNPTLLYCP